MTPRQHINVIPADPGYFALDRYFVPGGIEIEKLPVVAWCIRIEDDEDYYQHQVEPICLEIFSSEFCNEVLHPDGRVIRRGVQIWKSLEEFETEAKSKFEYTNPKYSQFVNYFEANHSNNNNKKGYEYAPTGKPISHR